MVLSRSPGSPFRLRGQDGTLYVALSGAQVGAVGRDVKPYDVAMGDRGAGVINTLLFLVHAD
jgi:hypothetical protein